MSLKGFYASYLAVERVERGENINTNNQELVTPFPGSLKSIYSNQLSNSHDGGEARAPDDKQYETYNAFQKRNNKKKP